jgi:hypothetical protein
VFISHRWMIKSMRSRDLSGSVENGFRQLGLSTIRSGDGWRVGDDNGRALLVCQVMPISDRQCHVMIVAASETKEGGGVCGRLASFIEQLSSFD